MEVSFRLEDSWISSKCYPHYDKFRRIYEYNEKEEVMSNTKRTNLFIVLLLTFTMLGTAILSSSQAFAATASQKKKEAAEAGAKSAAYNNKVGEATQQVEQLEASINSKQAEINATKAQVEAKKQAMQEQSKSLDSRVRAMYKTGNAGLINIILSSDNVNELITNVSMVQKVLSNDKKLLASLQDQYKEIQELQVKQEEQEKALAEDKAKMENVRDQYKDLAEEYAKKEDQLNAEGNRLAAEAAAQQAAAEERLRQQQAAAEAAAAARPSQSSNSGSSAPSKPSSSASRPSTSTPSAPASSGYRWPTNGGKITSPFGWRIHPIFKTRKYHDGIDISGLRSGTPVYAIANGTVTRSSWYGGYGNCVQVYVGNGRTALYAHLSGYAVSNGQYVTKGQVVGYIGSTGWSTGPHLHFGLSVGGRFVDPTSIY